MAGRKPKADTLRIAELTEKIEKAEKLMSVQEKRIQQYKEERAGLLAHLIVGQMEERHLNYPQVESLLTQLFKGEPSPRQSQKLERHGKDSPPEAQGQGIAELKVRVSAKEKKQIYKNMKKANYDSGVKSHFLKIEVLKT